MKDDMVWWSMDRGTLMPGSTKTLPTGGYCLHAEWPDPEGQRAGGPDGRAAGTCLDRRVHRAAAVAGAAHQGGRLDASDCAAESSEVVGGPFPWRAEIEGNRIRFHPATLGYQLDFDSELVLGGSPPWQP